MCGEGEESQGPGIIYFSSSVDDVTKIDMGGRVLLN